MALRSKAAVVHGRPCRHGHGNLRYIKGNECVVCARSRANKQYVANPEKVKAANNVWRAENPEKVLKMDRRRRAANPEKMKANHLRWRRNNSEKHNANGCRWAANNPAKGAAKTARYRAHRLQATPKWLTAEQKAKMLGFYTRANDLGLEVDHIVPLKGKTVCGLHVPWNLGFLTRSENAKKGNRLGG